MRDSKEGEGVDFSLGLIPFMAQTESKGVGPEDTRSNWVRLIIHCSLLEIDIGTKGRLIIYVFYASSLDLFMILQQLLYLVRKDNKIFLGN